MNNHLLGFVKISDSTIFDSHLLVFVIPFLVLIFSLKSNLKNYSSPKKDIFLKAFAAFILFGTALVLFNNEGSSRGDVDKVQVFNNLDLLSGLVFSFALITKRYSIARIATPAVIIFSSIRLINNPGVELDNLESALNVFSICAAIVFIAFSKKTISVNEFVFGQIVNLAMIAYVFVFNDFAGTAFSTFSLQNISNNPIYDWMKNDAQKIVLFLMLSITSQFAIWIVIRFGFLSSQADCLSVFALFADLREEIKNGHFKAKNTFEEKWGFFSTENLEEISVEESESSALEFDTEISNNYEIRKNIEPLSLVRVKNSQGIRAP